MGVPFLVEVIHPHRERSGEFRDGLWVGLCQEQSCTSTTTPERSKLFLFDRAGRYLTLSSSALKVNEDTTVNAFYGQSDMLALILTIVLCVRLL